MATDDEITTEIKNLLSSPQRTTSDEGTVQERPTKDLIDAANYLAAAVGTRKKGRGVRMSAMKFPGTP